MKKREIYGTIIVALGLSALVVLYKVYYLPKKEVSKLSEDELKKATQIKK